MITIVTSTLNCSEKLKITADSLRNQSLQTFEWIVADGASSDGTLSVITENSDLITKSFSEKDSGIYDAWNSARKFIHGDWVIFLGAGDTFHSRDTLFQLSTKLKIVPESFNFAFGNLQLVDDNTSRRICHTGVFTPRWEDLNLSTPPHSATLTRSSIVKNNHFDPSFRIIADRLFMIRHSSGRYYNLDLDLVIMDGSGISNSYANIPKIWEENVRLSKLNPPAPLLHLLKAHATNRLRVAITKTFGTGIVKALDNMRRH
jgi:glycosyltransferase involved in cell wall biosynthesis